jgi:UDP-glucose:(heptosyl)LPS alpha-1,3-glucosyltransferase
MLLNLGLALPRFGAHAIHVNYVTRRDAASEYVMRVALAIEYFDPFFGGAPQWTIGFAKYLLECGHAVIVVAFRSENHSLPVESYVLPHSKYPLERARRISRCIEALKPDVVYDAGTSWSGNVVHPHAGSLLFSHQIEVARFPIMRRLGTSISPRGWFFRWSLARVESLQMAHAERVIAVSERVRALLSGRYDLPDHKLVVVPNGVDTVRFAPERLAELRPQARRNLNVGGRTLFLLIAQNMLLKGVDNAIWAMGKLVREGAPVQLAIAGATPDRSWVRRVTRAGAVGRVDFLGHVADVLPLYAAADSVVHPTRWDACSLATLEGMAAGLPVVTTLRNGAAERIRDGENGLLIADPEDTDSLSAQMRRLLDPNERARIGAAARETAMKFELRDNFRQLERILIDVAAEKFQHCTARSTPNGEAQVRYEEA